MNAAHAGNAEVVRDLLNRGANPNERSKDSHATPLIFAAAAGRVEVVRLLLARGANPNLCAWGDTCPIWWATTSGSIETMRLLLEAGADVNRQPSPDALESPSLKIAAASGRADIAKVLLDHGIKVDYTNFFSEHTALASAVFNGRTDVAKLLIEHGADLAEATEVPYSAGETALEHAKKKGYTATVEVVSAAIKSKGYQDAQFSVEGIMEKLYRDPAFELAAQGEYLVKLLRKQDMEILRYIRNTIFARKDYRFDDPELIKYFQKKFPAYRPRNRQVEMTGVDKRNVQYMRDIEEYRAARDAAG